MVGVDGRETGCTRPRAGGSRGEGGIVPVATSTFDVDVGVANGAVEGEDDTAGHAVSIFNGGGGVAREPLVDAERVRSTGEGALGGGAVGTLNPEGPATGCGGVSREAGAAGGDEVNWGENEVEGVKDGACGLS